METLTSYVVEYGDIVVFVLAILETSFITGLPVPSGATAAFAAALAVGNTPAILSVAIAASAGGFIGDLIGYWIGRTNGPRLMENKGWIGKSMRKHDQVAGEMINRHPFVSVTMARVVTMVRTMSPLSAGMARMPFRTYVLFNIPGVLAWVGMEVGIGVLAGESWKLVSGMVGAGWVVLFAGVAGFMWWRGKKSSSKRQSDEVTE